MRIIRRISATDEVRKEYFQWLCGLVGVSTPDHSYWLLATELHKKEFYWSVPNDDDRAADGKQLREDFFDETNYRCKDCNLRAGYNCLDCLDGPCSIFEMLIALAIRMEFILSDSSREEQTAKYFWDFIRNLGLESFTDEDFFDRTGPFSLRIILEKFLERNYTSKGDGGIFPLKRPGKDQRKVDIWYQMSAYISENYTF